MRTKDEIIIELFALLAGASYSGALLKEEEELYNQLLNEYEIIRKIKKEY